MKKCNDNKCPLHGKLATKNRRIRCIVIATDLHRTATVELPRRKYIPKYERYEKKRTRLRVHNPECINAKKGDLVVIAECKPLSKTKHFVIVEKIGKDVLFKQREEALEEGRFKEKEKEEPKEGEKQDNKDEGTQS